MVIFSREVISQKVGFWHQILGFSQGTLLVFAGVPTMVLKVLGLVLEVVALDPEFDSTFSPTIFRTSPSALVDISKIH